MKRLTYLLLLSLILGCNTATKKETSISGEEGIVVVQESKENKSAPKAASNSTYLCKINGDDWAYTKASGVITTHAKTGKRTALITFKKKLEKGSESIQLRYDANSFELEVVSIQLRFQKKEGGLFTCYYELFPDTRDRYPDSEISGTIDLSDPTSASGEAEIKNLDIKYEKEGLQNPDDAVISITDLKFTGIGYSDLDKVTKSLTK